MMGRTLGNTSIVLVALVLAAVSAAHPEDDEPRLSPRHQEFVESFGFLLSEEERAVFLQLSEEHRRDAFLRRFWQVRDPYPETGRNELFDRLDANLRAVKDRFGGSSDDRSRLMLLYGAPDREERQSCDRLRPLELWHFAPGAGLRQEAWAVFVRVGSGWRLWRPSEGLSPLLAFRAAVTDEEAVLEIEQSCSRADQLFTALALSPAWDVLEEELLPRPGGEWAQAFLASSTELPAGVEAMPLHLTVEYVGRHQSRTVVKASALLDSAEVGSALRRDRKIVNLLVDGEVVHGGELFDRFRYRFDLPVQEDDEATDVPVVVERFLRPGAYRLDLKVQDLSTDRYFVASSELDVPRWSPKDAAESQLSARLEDSSLGLPPIAVSEGVLLPERPVVRLRVPGETLITGRVRIEALSEGTGIERVGFALNGQTVLTKARPPYSVEIDVGSTPRAHQVAAFALDSQGNVLARDEVTLNSGPHRFSIRLVEPQRGHKYQGLVRAAAEVEVPRLERLDRVEVYLNEALVATLFQPPFVQTLRLPEDLALGYVRAVAVLANGTRVEDVVFVNAPDAIDHLDVDFVELYTTVLDRRGRPVEDLVAEDFAVREDGELQDVRRFERVRDLSIYAGVLLDISTSMDTRLVEAEAAALHFFDRVLTDKDRGCLMTFNDRHQLVVPFTGDLEVLAGGLAELVAEGETALYDSLLHALFYFSGLTGKRALVLVSDGEDSSSKYRFDEVLDFARRSGVTIYAVGVSIDQRSMEVRSALTRLCQETGGTCHYIESIGELRGVYERIEGELRSQYLLAYQSSSRGEDFRSVEVDVSRPGLRARTLPGYYP